MRNTPILVCALCCAVLAPALKPCGTERQKVKNLADPQAANAFNSLARDMTVSDLAAMPSRPTALILQYKEKRFPEEHFRAAVKALLIGYKLEADEDYHLVLADPDNRRVTMIAEIPSPDCITIDLRDTMAGLRDDFDAKIGKPSSKYKKLPHPLLVSVEGVLFRDPAHGQTGAAPSGVELHPILRFERVPVTLPAHSAMAKLECDRICSNPCQKRCFDREYCPTATP